MIMDWTKHRVWVGWIVALLASGVLLAAADRGARPNIVLIVADDLGWADLGCYGADLHETPRLDQFAREGVKFSHAYAMSVCSPSRAMLLTGQHAARLGMTIWREGALQKTPNRRLIEADAVPDLPHSRKTLATHLKAAGYLTASVGKWHLGDAEHAPETHGFDVNIGGTHWGAPQTYWWPYAGVGRFGAEHRYVPHLEFGRNGEYLTDRLTDEALRVIDHADGRPFFLYLAHHAPHTPIEAKPEDVLHFQGKVQREMRHRNPEYAAMLRSLDENIGRVFDHLHARRLTENTVVIVVSDNGGQMNIDPPENPGGPETRNAPLRSGKGSLYEGGIRVPLLVRWPGVTPRGVQCAEPVQLADLFATLLAAGAPETFSREKSTIDGVDLKPLLRKPGSWLDREYLFFHYPHYYATTSPVSAVRSGKWKLLHYHEDDRFELYNLAKDPGETTDLVDDEWLLHWSLRYALDEWRQEVGAKLPRPNPDYKPVK